MSPVVLVSSVAEGGLVLFSCLGGGVQCVTQASGWTRWTELGSAGYDITDIAVGTNSDGRLEVFAIDKHGTALHLWQTSPNGPWTDWAGLGSGYQIAKLAVAQNSDGRLEVFAVDRHGTALHIWQPDWSGWAGLGSGYQIADLAVGQNSDGRLEVFAFTTHGTALHIWQPDWSGWAYLASGYEIADLAVGQNADGRLEVFAVDRNGTPLHVAQPDWPGWAAAGSGPRTPPLTVARNLDGRLEAFDAETPLYNISHIWQTTPGGALSAWTVLAPVLLPAPSWADPAETNLTETSVTLHWQAVPAAQQYILDAVDLSTGLAIGAGWIAPAGDTELLITGLTPATGYAFHLTYQTAMGQKSEPATAQLYTLTPPVSAVTEPATNLSANSATLNGTVQSQGATATYYFEYGLTTAYGTKTGNNVAQPGAVHQVSQAVSGLQPSTTYHFRLAASSAKGAATGNDATFTTSAAIPKSGTDYVSLAQEGAESFNYSADVPDPNELAVDLGQATAAYITGVTSTSWNCSLSIGGGPRFNLSAGQTVTVFNGTAVKGYWSAEFSGSVVALPFAIPMKVTWARP